MVGVLITVTGSLPESFTATTCVPQHANMPISASVQGSRRRNATGEFPMGSSRERVLLDAPVPVLTVMAPE